MGRVEITTTEPGEPHEHPTPDDDGLLRLDAAAWAELCTLLPEVVIPQDFAASWDAVPDAESLRGPALARLRTAGVVDDDGHPHPALVDLLRRLSAAPVRIRVRSGVADRVILAHLATGWDTTVALTRAQRVVEQAPAPSITAGHGAEGATSGPHLEDGTVVDVAAFATTDLADRLWQLLPPALTEHAPPTACTDGHGNGAPGESGPAQTELAWADAVALLHALRRAPSWPVAVRREVVADLLAEAGLDDVPDVLPSLAPDLAGAVDITAILLPGTPAQRQWQGLWLLTGDGRVVAVAQPRGTTRRDTDVHGPAAQRPSGEDTDDAARGGSPRVRLLDVDAANVRQDILRSLADVLATLADSITDAAPATGANTEPDIEPDAEPNTEPNTEPDTERDTDIRTPAGD